MFNALAYDDGMDDDIAETTRWAAAWLRGEVERDVGETRDSGVYPAEHRDTIPALPAWEDDLGIDVFFEEVA